MFEVGMWDADLDSVFYLEGHGDLVSKLVTPRTHIVTLLTPRLQPTY